MSKTKLIKLFVVTFLFVVGLSNTSTALDRSLLRKRVTKAIQSVDIPCTPDTADLIAVKTDKTTYGATDRKMTITVTPVTPMTDVEFSMRIVDTMTGKVMYETSYQTDIFTTIPDETTNPDFPDYWPNPGGFSDNPTAKVASSNKYSFTWDFFSQDRTQIAQDGTFRITVSGYGKTRIRRKICRSIMFSINRH